MIAVCIILAVIAVIAVLVFIVAKFQKADKEADKAFEAEYGKFVGQEVWLTSFLDDKVFDEQKNRISDLDGFDCYCRYEGTTPEFFPCKITKITRNYDGTDDKGKIKLVPLTFEADFEIKYISRNAVFLYAEKYGELAIGGKDGEVYEMLKEYTSPTVRLKCRPVVVSEEKRELYGYIDFFIFWDMV